MIVRDQNNGMAFGIQFTQDAHHFNAAVFVQGACRLIPARWAPSPPSCGFGSLERTRDRRPRAARQGSRLGRPSRPRPRWREIGSRRTNFDEVVVGRSQPVLKGPKAPCHQARHQRVATGPIGANGAVTKPSPKTPDRTRGKSTAPVAEIGVVGTIRFRHGGRLAPA